MSLGDAACTRCRLHKIARDVCAARNPRRNDVMVILERAGYVPREIEQALPDAEYSAAVWCVVKDHSPTKGEIKACKHWLDQHLAATKPKFVLLVGNAALQSITGKAGIKSARGRPFEQDGVLYLPMYNPGIAKHDPSAAALVDNDLKLFQTIVKNRGIPREKNVNPVLVRTPADFKHLIDSLRGTVSFDLETTCLYPWQKVDEKGQPAPAKITLIGFGTEEAQFSIPWDIPESPWSEEAKDDMIQKITERLEDCFLVTHNGKFDLLWMAVKYGVWWRNDFDTMLASYILDENRRHGLKELAQKFCGAPNWDVDSDTKRGNKSIDKLALYHAHDLYYTRKLRYVFGQELKKDPQVKRVFDKIMMRLSNIFVEVEFDGVYIDVSKYNSAKAYLHEQLRLARKELSKFAQINWSSTKQLRKLLFEELKLPVIEKTKTGTPSCNESVLKRLDHPIAGALLKYREAKQQMSFFIEGWKPFFDKRKDGIYLHPSFKLHGTVTGRLSCEHPNLQQVPRDKRIRSLISAPPGWTFVECDLSQIELRIAAELAGERTMLDSFARGIDIHWMTCLREIERGGGQKELVLNTARTATQNPKLTYSEAIDVLLKIGPDTAADIDERWKEMRKKAKAVNFGYLYGMWWKKFKIYARDNYGVILDDKQARASREFYFATFRDLEAWHERQRRFARRNGYVRTLSGRKRRLPAAMLAEDTPERREAERQAINSPVQSFANEINLMAVIQLREEFSRDIVRICGTVHDAILLRVRNEHVERVVSRLLEIMQRPKLMDVFNIELSVPIEAEAKIGPWGEGVAFEKWRAECSKSAIQRSKLGAGATTRRGLSMARNYASA